MFERSILREAPRRANATLAAAALCLGLLAATVPAAPVNAAPPADSVHYTLLASDGGVFTGGSAKHLGSLANIKLNAPIVGGAIWPAVRVLT